MKGKKKGTNQKESMIPSSPLALTQKGDGHGEKKESKRGEGINEKSIKQFENNRLKQYT
jgi:hypothetical protein